MRLERTKNNGWMEGRMEGRMEADNQSEEVEIGQRRERGNSRSIDDVRYEEEEEAPNITRVDCLETDPQRLPLFDSVLFTEVHYASDFPALVLSMLFSSVAVSSLRD